MSIIGSAHEIINYQFNKCGPLSSSVFNPWAPFIKKAAPIIPIIERRSDNRIIMNLITRTISSKLDCPIEVIKEINALKLSDARKMLYYKALYQSIPYNIISKGFTFADMYYKYYADMDLRGYGYSFSEKQFIIKSKYNMNSVLDLYKQEYIKCTKWI